MLGIALSMDALLMLQGMLCTYSTSAALSASYNLGAIAGVLYTVQLSSGVAIAMSYVASEDAYSALDTACVAHACCCTT